MQVYISFAILVVIVLLFAYILMLARKLKKQRTAMVEESKMQSTQVIQSRAETTVFGMIGILIIDYALTFPEKNSETVFFFYGKTGIVIGVVILLIAIGSFVFANPKKVM